MRKAYDELTRKHRIEWRVLTLFEAYLPLPKLQQIVRIGGSPIGPCEEVANHYFGWPAMLEKCR